MNIAPSASKVHRLLSTLLGLSPLSTIPASVAGAATTTTTKPKPAGAAATMQATPISAQGTTRVEVASDVDHYYVLFAKPVAGDRWETPVAIAKGQSGTTVLTDGRKQLPTQKYRVETFANTKPGDVDADGVDDLTELNGGAAFNALSAVKKLKTADGVAIVSDRATFVSMSYQGTDVARDSYLAGLQFVKFFIIKGNTPKPLAYVMNTKTWRMHPKFAQAIGISTGRGRGGAPGEMRGDVAFYPKAIGPDGTPGLYRFAFQPNDSYSFAEISVAYEALVTQMPFLAAKFAYFPHQGGLAAYKKEKSLYDASRVPVVLDAQLVN